MKFPVLFLAVSLAANVALALLFLKAPSQTPGSALQSHAADAAAETKTATGTGTAEEDAVWPALIGQDDLPGMVERLRAGGFPPDVIRAIVGAQIAEQFRERRRTLTGTPEAVPFWQTGVGPLGSRVVMIGSGVMLLSSMPGQTPENQAALRELNREQSRLMEQLIGSGVLPMDELQLESYRQNYGYLFADKVVELQRLNRDYNDLRMEVATAATANTPANQEKLALLENELRADLTQLLSPDELEEYDLRSSPTASLLRARLDAFNPSEEEFRALFRVQRALEEKQGISSYGRMDQAKINSLSSGALLTSTQGITQPEVQAELLRVLSPERFEEFQMANDPVYRTVSRITARFGLPMSAAQQVVTVQKDIQQRFAALRSDRNLPPEQRNAQLVALEQEATGRITEAIGADGLEAYREYGGGWLNTLRPRDNPIAR